MKLGISYNLFDSEELLEGSIKQIRDLVDYVSVVYQKKSNFGNPCTENLVPLLEKLKSDGLIDELFEYIPQSLGGHGNELNKRNIGLQISKTNGCTHHMSMDSDEYFLPNEFKYLKDKITEGDYDSSFAQMLTYYKSWEYQLDPPEEYYVPLIIKIKNNNEFTFNYPSPVLVDPTRRVSKLNEPLVLTRNEIQMHHGSYIRDDIRVKLINSSASVNFNNEIDNIVNHYNNWEYPDKVLWGGAPSKYLNIKKSNKLFN
jgi:hypothetical protein